MFERFTDRARRVIVLAQEEARMLNHNYIGTEHILLGLIHERQGVAAKSLESFGISLDAVRQQVEEIIGQGQSAPTGHIPFTPRAKKVLEMSLREALELSHNYIGTEHILLGILREGEGVASQVLQKTGADLSRVRSRVIEVLSGYTDVEGGATEHVAAKPEADPEAWPLCPRCGGSLKVTASYGNLGVPAAGGEGEKRASPSSIAGAAGPGWARPPEALPFRAVSRRPAIALALLVAMLSPPGVEARTAAAASIEPFRGLGAWVDIFEDRAWKRPAKAVADMASHGVRTLYLQTSNYSQDHAIAHPEGVSRFLNAAHRRGMDVVAWYLPGFAKLGRDFRRTMAAIRYRSPSGERFDAFGLDIEASILGPPSERTERLLSLSRRIRGKVGRGYTLGAIIPSPVGIKLNKGYWPKFPYEELAETYDAFVPMGYFTYHVEGAEKTHDETARNVEIIREETGNPAIPIHMIGGVADEASGPEVQAFVHAVREHGLLGASLYNWSLTQEHDWEPLETVPANPRQSPPLPLTLPFAEEVGNVPGEDRTHPKEVVYRTGPATGARMLGFEAFDIEADEVHIWVNWRLLQPVATSGAGNWSERQEVPIPEGYLDDGGENIIAFVASGEAPDWTEWGVRAVSLT